MTENPADVIPRGEVIFTRPRPHRYPGTDAAEGTDRPRYFLVTSQGLAATGWLASSLNLHPDITCSAGIDHPLVSMGWNYYDGDLIEKKIAALSHPDEFRHGFYRESMRQRVRQVMDARGISVVGALQRDNPVRQLQHMYDELEWFAPQSRYYGNTHACFAAQAIEYLTEFPTRHDVLLVNLIRHPVPRTEAAIRNLAGISTLFSGSDWHTGISESVDACVDQYADRRRDAERRFGVDFRDRRHRATLYSYCHALHNDCWAGEIVDVRTACHIPIERLMTDREYFAWLIWELTGREVFASDDLLQRLYTEDHLQSGRVTGRGRAPGARAQYHAWSEWERQEFREAASRLGLANVYARFGYDFSFVQ